LIPTQPTPPSDVFPAFFSRIFSISNRKSLPHVRRSTAPESDDAARPSPLSAIRGAIRMRAYQSSVYVWGSTANDALGCFPNGVRVQPAPRRLALCCSTTLAGEDGSNAIRVIASGSGDRTTVITDKFVAYSWGGGTGRREAERGGGEKRRGGGASRSGKSGSSCTIDRVQVEDATNVTHGMGHSCAISSRGEIYGWGSNVHGALGVGPDNDAFGISSSSTTDRGGSRPQIISGSGNGARRVTANPHPRKLLLGDDSSKADVVAVACGEKHTCILRRDGTILTAGANDACQLGIGAACHKHGPKEKNNSGFCIIQTSVRRGLALSVAFKELSCGNNHCAAISSDDASLYTWGWGQSGRLGTGDEGCRDRPTYVEALSDLVPLATVACGSAHTLVATADGDVYGFGWNAHGQVSGAAKYDNEDDAASDICLSPVPCLTQKGVVALSCGNFHTAAVTQSGNLYMWGKSYGVDMNDHPPLWRPGNLNELLQPMFLTRHERGWAVRHWS
jgi:alpha-tubulin suppressor-like RCC1 family protein